MTLIERGRELRQVDGRLAEACAGRGNTVLVEGPPGIGKTALLAAVHERATQHKMDSLGARGGELERELAFAIVRQLFEPRLRAAARADLFAGAARFAAPVFDGGTSGEAAPAIDSVVHGLYWLCSNVAGRGSLLLTVDDVHWADEASLRFLSHLARRVADLPVLLVLATRPPPPGTAFLTA